ncbi:MAG: hypothetical protein ABIF19_14660 [Planctomycetota bacterium]
MSKRLIYLGAFVALSMLLLLQPASAQIFYADFEDGSGVNDPAQWVPDNAGQAWGIADFPGSGKGLKNINEGCGTSGNTPLPGVTNFSDGIIQLDMSWEDDDSWGVVFRKTADDAGYLVVFGYIETPFVIIADLADGCAATGLCLDEVGCENGGKELISVPHTFGTNLTMDLSVSYTGRIEVIGDSIRVWYLPTADIVDPLGDLGAPLVEFQHGAHAGPGSVGIWHESQGGSMIDNVMVLAAGGQPLAWAPDPPDGALIKDTWVNLSWRPGDFAISHDLYLGDNFDNVNDGTGDTLIGNQAGTFIIAGFPGFPYPDGLIPGTTYYWRVDEVNDANTASPWKGNIWSFSTQPYTAYDPKPVDGAEFVAPDATFTWTPGYGAKLHTVYMGTDYDTVDNATGGPPVGPAQYKPAAPLESEKVYYWRVDEFDAFATHKGDIWAFTTPGAAGNPQPANGATGAAMVAKPGWAPATNAASHDVYFGTDKDAVRNATKASPEFKGNKAPGSESLDPGKLSWLSDYYWRVDAVYNTGTVKGLVWSFTTADFITVEDFESYNDIDPPDAASNRIFDNWIDGFGTTNNGALVGNDLPPYAEQTVVHGGAQSMPYTYDNNQKTSEATLTLVYPRDWTAEGVTRLSLWFRGASANSAERMYVALNGNAVVYNDDPAATQKGGWNQWIIDLTAFTGVNLANVNTITIGLGTKNSPAAGGSGKMYFDDIRLVR